MKSQYKTLDDIAVIKSGYKISTPKQKYKTNYYQRMQSLMGSRKFLLTTIPQGDDRILVMLQEDKNGQWVRVGTRSAIYNDEQSIHKAIISLQRKAKCKLFYILLIGTDGEYH